MLIIVRNKMKLVEAGVCVWWGGGGGGETGILRTF